MANPKRDRQRDERRRRALRLAERTAQTWVRVLVDAPVVLIVKDPDAPSVYDRRWLALMGSPKEDVGQHRVEGFDTRDEAVLAAAAHVTARELPRRSAYVVDLDTGANELYLTTAGAANPDADDRGE